MHKTLVLLLALAALVVSIPAGLASTCVPTTSEDALRVDEFYVVLETLDVLVYEESNDVGGLQRFDYGRDDTCQLALPADARVF